MDPWNPRACWACPPTGRRNQKQAPFVRHLAPMSPPMDSTSPLQMLNPSPLPFSRGVALRSCEKGLNIRGMSSSSMPMPSSNTSNLTNGRVSRTSGPSDAVTLTVTVPPTSQYFTALLSRLVVTCLSREGSDSTMVGVDGWMSSWIFTSFSTTTLNFLSSPRITPSSCCKSKLTSSKVTLPSCTLFRSRTSSTMQFITLACAISSWMFSSVSASSSDCMKWQIPKAAVSGFRNSWQTYCRNLSLARMPASSARIACICASSFNERRRESSSLA
mmetsp:Transcript_28910/g.66840  ORF Transcript_28910/g.66840 Transcript_28910/m.66840 type:complete len:273 (+) Transcript_28910:810-1628(+)